MTAQGDPRRASRKPRRGRTSPRRRPAPPPPSEPGIGAAPPADDSGTPPGLESVVVEPGIEKELEILKEQNLRLQAEFDNYRKRQAREFHKLCSQGKRDLIFELLAILDDIDLARRHAADGAPADETLAGLLQIAAKFEALLTRQGLEAIPLDAMDPFDPTEQEAVFAEDAEGVTHDVVLEVIRKGYFLDQDLLRAALVRVGRAGKPSTGDGE